MACISNITAETVRQLLSYDPESGKLTWKWRERKFFANETAWKTWNKKWAGTKALEIKRHDRYLTGSIFGIRYRTHRIIWLMHYGEWPSDHLDHIDGRRDNNRISNLRIASNSDNMKNVAMNAHNTSGVNGVYWRKDRQKWVASLNVNRKTVALGCFYTKEEAIAARLAANEKYGFSDRHGQPLTPAPNPVS